LGFVWSPGVGAWSFSLFVIQEAFELLDSVFQLSDLRLVLFQIFGEFLIQTLDGASATPSASTMLMCLSSIPTPKAA